MTNYCGGFFVFGISYFYVMILTSADQLKVPPKRIISLVPSQTELLYSLSLEEETIAITKFCIHPKQWFKNKPKIGGTKTVDIDKVNALKPDLIIANKEENVKEQVEMLATSYPVWVTDINNLEDAFQMIEDIGKLTRKEKAAGILNDKIKSKFNIYIQNNIVINSIPTIYLIWKEPYMTVGSDTFISNMMGKACLKNVFSSHLRYPVITVDQIKSTDCKLILLSSEPYPFKQKHIDALQKELPGITIRLVNGEMFSWYGSRLLLVPDYFKELIEDLKI